MDRTRPKNVCEYNGKTKCVKGDARARRDGDGVMCKDDIP